MTQLAFDRRGAGPSLLLVHGIGSRRGAWDPVVARLAGDRETIAVDLPGFGDSPPLPDGVTPDVAGLTDAIERFVAALDLDAPPHVAGNSLGGAIALELARRGAVASATALSPIGFWTPAEIRYARALLRSSRAVAQRLEPLAPQLVRSVAGRIALGSLYFGRPARLAPHELLADLRGLAHADEFEATLRIVARYLFEDGSALRVPVTIGWGTRDRLLLSRQAQRARAALPYARHVPLAGCGHVPMPDDPDAIAALLREASAPRATPVPPAGSPG